MDSNAQSVPPAAWMVFAIIGAGLVTVVIKFWFVFVPLLIIAAVCWWHIARRTAAGRAAAQAALEAEAAERVHQAELAAAQLQHHLDGLSAADPIYSRLMADLQAVPPTRPADQAEIRQAMADRFVIIDQFAREFAELERAGQPVPDHGATMRGLVEQERAWDARHESGRHGGGGARPRPRSLPTPGGARKKSAPAG